MIHKEIVSPEMWDTMQKLMQDEMFKDYFLAADTAMCLQTGHRKPKNIKLYTTKKIDLQSLYHLQKNYKGSNKIFIDTVVKHIPEDIPEFNFFSWNYPVVKPLIHDSGLRLMSLQDIGAILLSPISEGTIRKQDLVDLSFLLDKYPLKTYLSAFEKKFGGNGNVNRALVNLFRCTPFNPDAEIKSSKGKDWDRIKERIIKAATDPSFDFGKNTLKQPPLKQKGLRR